MIEYRKTRQQQNESIASCFPTSSKSSRKPEYRNYERNIRFPLTEISNLSEREFLRMLRTINKKHH